MNPPPKNPKEKFFSRFNPLIPKIAKLKYLRRQRNLMQQIQNTCVQHIESGVRNTS